MLSLLSGSQPVQWLLLETPGLSGLERVLCSTCAGPKRPLEPRVPLERLL